MGGRVWNDLNADGHRQAGEPAIASVSIYLKRASDGAVVGVTGTDAAGKYQFTGLSAGNYLVLLEPQNFSRGRTLFGFLSSPGFAPANDDLPDDDSGIDTHSRTLDGVVSTAVELSEGGEPDVAIDGDDTNGNQTIDFGFYAPQQPPVLALGGTVWHDLNGNGHRDSGEPGIPGVVFYVFYDEGDGQFAGGETLVAVTSTDSSGHYSVSGLEAGGYFARVEAWNFNSSGPLFGTVSSPGYGPANNDVAGDDSGVGVPSPANTGVTCTVLTLSNGQEPGVATDNDGPDSNQTLDFGFRAPPETNFAPVFTCPVLSTRSCGNTQGCPFDLTFNVSDPDNDTLMVSVGEGASVFEMKTIPGDTASPADITFSNVFLRLGQHNLSFAASDSINGWVSCSTTVTVFGVESAQTRGNQHGVTVGFSSAVNETTATNPANYTVPGVVVSNVTMLSASKVLLATSLLSEGQVYTLFVNGVQSGSEPPVSTAPDSQIEFLQTQGVITRKEYDDVNGGTIADLTNSTKFPTKPNSVSLYASLESPADIRDNYGVMFQGYVTAPVSGDYTFYINSDDQGVLYLSANTNAANKQLIAREPEWNTPRAWISGANQGSRGVPPVNVSAPVHLQAASVYYLEAIMKESGGGDNLAVAWRKPGDPPLTNGSPPIPGQYLSSVSTLVPAAIVAQPISQTVQEFAGATFSITVSGTPPLDIQWLKNGVMIPGANSTNLQIISASAADDGAEFSAQVADGTSLVRSATALLTVIPDLTPPEVLWVESSPTLDKLVVKFSEPIAVAGGTNPSNYTISGGLIVLAVSLSQDGRTVRVETTKQNPGQNYVISFGNIRDISAHANLLAPDTQKSFRAFVLSRGFLRREVYLHSPGTTISELLQNGSFPDAPDSVVYTTRFEAPSNQGDNYGQRFSGYLIPQATGSYVFFISSDDQGMLYLSPNDDPQDKIRIAFEPLWNPARNWIGTERRNPSAPENRSASIVLEAGKMYYIEALMQEGTGGDNLGVAWQGPGDPLPENSSLPISGTYLACYANPLGASVEVFGQPADQKVNDQQTATFEVRAIGTPNPIAYQWQRNGQDIPNAVHASYTTPLLTLADDGASFRCVVSVPGASVVSSPAALHVTNDTQPPRLLSVEGSVGLDRVVLHFSEPVNALDATNITNYTLSGGAQVLRAEIEPNQTTVLLYTSPQVSGTKYTLNVAGIHDRSSAANPVETGTGKEFIAYVPEEFVGPFPSWADLKRDYGAVGDGVADDTAALQKALDALGNPNLPLDTIIPGRPYVLWIPAGTYRITAGLDFEYRMAVSIFGDHPTNTIIKWDGPIDGVMLLCNGVSHGRISRLTFDGAGIAGSAINHKWDGSNKQPHGTSGGEYSDLVIRNVQFGIRAGIVLNDAEVSVLRCQFANCSQMGISMESYNAVDWWVWHSIFDHCRVGAGNSFGAGVVNVYESLFLGSLEADLTVGNCVAFTSFCRNTSRGSKAFLVAGFNDCAAQITVEGNKILDTQDTLAINVNHPGPLLLIDNVIRSADGVRDGPVVYVADNLVSVGNLFTVNSPLQPSGRLRSIDDHVVDASSLSIPEMELPGTLPRLNRQVIEVPSGSGRSTIQAAINSAIALNGQRPVVHLPAGVYNIDQTLVVAAESDLQLVGDGWRAATSLQWTGNGSGPVLRLQGPSRATLRELSIHGAQRATGIEVDDCDQPGSRIFMEQASLALSKTNLKVDRLDETDVSLHGFGHGNSPGISLQIIGGPKRAAGGEVEGRVFVFGGSSGNNELTYELLNHASFTGTDIWSEGNQTKFLHLEGSGSFSLRGGYFQRYVTNAIPAIEVTNFQGQIALVATSFNNSDIVVAGDGFGVNLLALGTFSSLGERFVRVSDPATRFSVLSSVARSQDPGSNGTRPLADQGIDDPGFLTRMIQTSRVQQPRTLSPIPNEVTDLRFYRVFVWYCDVGIKLSRSNSVPELVTLPVQHVAEDETLRVTNLVVDADLPFDHVTFALGPGAPSGATIDASTGVFSWAPTEAMGPGTYPIDVIVRDDGSPPASSTNTILVAVDEVNRAPVLPVQPNRSVNELATLIVTNTATDPDLPANQLSYRLLGAPQGVAIDAAGIISWTPTEAQGPSTNNITTEVTDDGVPPLRATNTLVVFVQEVNQAPHLLSQPNRTIDELASLTVTNAATDPDVPANQLSYRLLGAPQGAAIDAAGIISWTPTEAQSPSTNTFVTEVTDDGVPSLQTTNMFVVQVSKIRRPGLLEPKLTQLGFVVSVITEPGIEYILEFKDSLEGGDWNQAASIAGDGTLKILTDPTPSAVQRFYRVRLR